MAEVVRQVVLRVPKDAVFSFLKVEGTDHRFADLSTVADSTGRALTVAKTGPRPAEDIPGELQAISKQIVVMVRANPWLGKQGSQLVQDIESMAGRLKTASATSAPAVPALFNRGRVMDEVPGSRIAFMAEVDGKGLRLEFDLEERGDSTSVTVRARFADASWVHGAELIVIGSVKDLLGFEHGFVAGLAAK